MKKAIADAWIKALRSGEYKQGYSQLRRDNKFCCLGVLCNLHAQAHPEIAKQQALPQVYMNHSAFLPPKVRAWAGMRTDVGFFDTAENSLAMLNDKKHTFKEIADVIEKRWKEL